MTVRIINGDCRDMLRTLPDESVHCVVTSPPYWGLRDYGVDGQIGLEASADDFVNEMVAVFREVRRALRSDGTLWLNLGDSYASVGGAGWQGKNGQRADRRFTAPNMKPQASAYGLKAKDLIGSPWMVAFALRADGWYLRQDIIWSKPNPMPESVTDRCTKAHEYLFLLSKSERYFYDAESVKEKRSETPVSIARRSRHDNGSVGTTALRGDGKFGQSGQGKNAEYLAADSRNKRSVWEVATSPFSEAHFATFPPALIEPCILAGCPAGGTVLDPFGGAGTTGLVADRLQRDAILIELNPEYAEMARRRIAGESPLFASVATESAA